MIKLKSNKRAGIGLLKHANSRFLFCAVVCFLVVVLVAPLNLLAANQSVEQRLQRMERLLANQNLIEMLTSLQALQQEVSIIRGDLDLLNHEMSQIKKQQKDIYIDLDQRLLDLDDRIGKLRLAPAIPGGNLSSPINEIDSEPGSVEDAQSALSKEHEYQNALSILRTGQYDEAIQAFQVYLISYPQSDLASNAQYWMAEAYYVLKDYESAVAQFNKVITAYPDSRKISDAHLKKGFSYYELEKWSDAKAALDVVVSQYADSTAARLANRRLDKMKIEGKL